MERAGATDVRPMLLSRAVAEGIRDGSVTAVFRRWDAPRVRLGGTQRTAAGVIRFTSVDRSTRRSLTEDDAQAPGWPRWPLCGRRTSGAGAPSCTGSVSPSTGPDERVALRAALPGSDEIAGIATALDRMDRGRRTGPWTRRSCGSSHPDPAVRAPDLAASLGRETKAVQARRPQAQGTRPHPQSGRRVRAVAARPGVPGRAGLTRTAAPSGWPGNDSSTVGRIRRTGGSGGRGRGRKCDLECDANAPGCCAPFTDQGSLELVDLGEKCPTI